LLLGVNKGIPLIILIYSGATEGGVAQRLIRIA